MFDSREDARQAQGLSSLFRGLSCKLVALRGLALRKPPVASGIPTVPLRAQAPLRYPLAADCARESLDSLGACPGSSSVSTIPERGLSGGHAKASGSSASRCAGTQRAGP